MCDYYYSDKPKTDMEKIKENTNNNKDFKTINKFINNDKKVNNNINNLNIDKTFGFLKITDIYLGFNSAPEIYEKYKKKFQEKNLEKKDSSHPSLFFKFEEDNNCCSYFVDYLPAQGNSKNAKFVYGNKYGLRYCEKSFDDFVGHNNTCIIQLISKKNFTFKNYFEKICENETWDKNSHNYENHNCNTFCIRSLELLEAKRLNDIENAFIFTKVITTTKKDAIKNNIPSAFYKILDINW